MSEDVNIRISAQDNATSVLRGIQSSIQGVADAATMLGGIGIAGVGIQQVGAFLGDSLKAFAESERAGIMLDRVLRTTGNTIRMTRAEIEAYAEERAAETTFDDDAIVEAATQLAKFRNLSGDMFKETLTDAQDLATFIGIDLVSATQMLGRAYSSPVDGMSKLKRAGILFTDEQEQQIKNAVELGKIAEASAIIQTEVRRTAAGAAQEELNTLSGKLQQLQKDWGEIKELTGSLIAPSIGQAADAARFVQGRQVRGIAGQAAAMLEQDQNQRALAARLQADFTNQVQSSLSAAVGSFEMLRMRREGASMAGTAVGETIRNAMGFFAGVAAEDAGAFVGRRLLGIVNEQRPEIERQQSLQATESRFLTRGRGSLSMAEKKQAEDNAKQLAELKAIKDAIKAMAEGAILVVEGVA
jgi:hypothetical protein